VSAGPTEMAAVGEHEPAPVFDDRRIMVVHKGRPVRAKRQVALAFAATMVVASAFVSFCWGLLALAGDAYWGGDPLHYGGVTTFGWLFLLMAIAELGIATLILAGSRVGAALGVLVVLGSIALHASTARAHPVASAALLAVDAAVAVILIGFAVRRPA
jgi:hypothetical protein